MKKIALILISLVLGVLFHFAGILLGNIATSVLTRKSPHQIVWLVGGYYIPFLICGMVLAVTRGFQYPRVLVPVCAFTVMGLFIAENPEPSAPTLAGPILLAAAVPLSFVGCLVAQALRKQYASNRE
jgi:hypothetical protein